MIRVFLFCTLLFLNPLLISAEGQKNLFQPENGDSVVFLGGTLIERAQQYGFWESMLISQTVDKEVVFRNLGWSGDNVFAESRGIFDPPAKGYQRMIERIKKINPRYLFISYGGNESFKGTDGVAQFLNQLEVVLKDVKGEKTEVILITPIMFEKMPAPLPDPAAANQNREFYINALKLFGQVHNLPVLELNTNLDHPKQQLTYNGIHLTSKGYQITANQLQNQIFLNSPPIELNLNSNGSVISQKGLTVSEIQKNNEGITFQIERESLPVMNFKNELLPSSLIRLTIKGLSKGIFTLSMDGKIVLKASSDEWNSGKLIQSKIELEQARKLNALVLKKNELYFHSWRPQNITYLFGFRKHEQGQNAKEVDEILKLVKKEEQKIYALQKNRKRVFTLTKD